MTIDWTALVQVCIATVAGTVLVVGVFAMSSSALSQARAEAADAGHRAGALRAVGYAGLVLAGLFVLYGLYLLVPYFHH